MVLGLNIKVMRLNIIFATIVRNFNRLISAITMFITNMTHFLDETMNIPKQIPKEAREMAGFISLVIDESTKRLSTTVIDTGIRCFKKKCFGNINAELLVENDTIHWWCTKCKNEGTISGWQNTRWDNR
jgi:hypothetical protein